MYLEFWWSNMPGFCYLKLCYFWGDDELGLWGSKILTMRLVVPISAICERGNGVVSVIWNKWIQCQKFGGDNVEKHTAPPSPPSQHSIMHPFIMNHTIIDHPVTQSTSTYPDLILFLFIHVGGPPKYIVESGISVRASVYARFFWCSKLWPCTCVLLCGSIASWFSGGMGVSKYQDMCV